MADLPNVNMDEINKIKEIASSGSDGPVMMLNLNRYVPEAGYPDGDLYKEYIAIVAKAVGEVGGKILWQTPVRGHVVGNQDFHETLGVWFPTHQAFLNLSANRYSEENMRLRSLAIEAANLLRCEAF